MTRKHEKHEKPAGESASVNEKAAPAAIGHDALQDAARDMARVAERSTPLTKFPPTPAGQTPVLPKLAPAETAQPALDEKALREAKVLEKGPGGYTRATLRNLRVVGNRVIADGSDGLPVHVVDMSVDEARQILDAMKAEAPAGETGRELTGDEAAAALAGHVSTTIPATTTAPPVDQVFDGKKTPPAKQPCERCGGVGTIEVGHGRNRCPACGGAGEVSVPK